MLLNREFDKMLHYLDDFLIILSSGIDPESYKEKFAKLCKMLGLKNNLRKEKINTLNDFLGIEINIILMKTRLPKNKLLKAIALVDSALRKKSITIEDLQGLVGFLTFAFRVVIPGRAFLRRLYNALNSSFNRIRLSSPIKQDLRWWKNFLPR